MTTLHASTPLGAGSTLARRGGLQRTTSPSLLVLAAGIGSRYGGLKQIDPVGPSGETIIDYSIYDAIRAGFGKVVFVIRRDIETAFKESITRKFEGRLPIEYAYQELDMLPGGHRVPAHRKKPWGTAHAILIAADHIHEPFAAINADDFYGANSFNVLCNHLKSTADAQRLPANDSRAGSTFTRRGGLPTYSMVGFTLRNTLSEHGSVARGVCECDERGWLKRLVEHTNCRPQSSVLGPQSLVVHATDETGHVHTMTGNEIVSMNMWGFTPSVFDHLREKFTEFLTQHGQQENSEFLIPTVVNTLVNTGQARVKVLPTPDSWFGVTYKEDKPRVADGIRRLIAAGQYPEKLW